MAGNVVELKVSGLQQVGGGTRKQVQEFTRKSRTNMLKRLMSISWPPKEQIRAIHLTYHVGPSSGVVCKSHLDSFRKRWERRFGSFDAVWKQEYQVRGVPHFHLLAIKPEGIPEREFKRWISEAWNEVTGEDEAHRKYGTRVEWIRHERGVMAYLAGYLASDKAEQHRVPDGWWNGRWWGVVGKRLKASVIEHDIEAETLPKIRRAMYALRRSRSKTGKGKKGVRKARRRLQGTWTWSDAPKALLRLARAYEGAPKA